MIDITQKALIIFDDASRRIVSKLSKTPVAQGA